MDTVGYIKIKNLFSLKNIKKEERQTTNWEKIFPTHNCQRIRLTARLYKGFKYIYILKEKWAEDIDKHFIEEEIEMVI